MLFSSKKPTRQKPTRKNIKLYSYVLCYIFLFFFDDILQAVDRKNCNNLYLVANVINNYIQLRNHRYATDRNI